MIYLDNSSTTKIDRRVFDAMKPYFYDFFGNPDGKYYEIAESAKTAVENARKKISEFLGCNVDEVFFNSGATEGNNTVIKGIVDKYQSKGNHIITTSVEHSSVYNTCKYLETKGIKVDYLPVNSECEIDLELLEQLITDKTILVSIMWVNNEVGTIFPIKEIAKICKKKGVLFHSDATQAIGKIKIDLSVYEGLNFVTFSGHKIYGPKGIGVLISRKDELGFHVPITPLIHGGEQERGLRSGTLNVPGIVGIGEACNILNEHIDEYIEKLIVFEKILVERLIEKFNSNIEINNNFSKVPGIINIRFKNINNQILLKKISPYIAASTGSACSNLKPSRVLLAMGYSMKAVTESVRFSLSPHNTLEELNNIIKIL